MPKVPSSVQDNFIAPLEEFLMQIQYNISCHFLIFSKRLSRMLRCCLSQIGIENFILQLMLHNMQLVRYCTKLMQMTRNIILYLHRKLFKQGNEIILHWRGNFWQLFLWLGSSVHMFLGGSLEWRWIIRHLCIWIQVQSLWFWTGWISPNLNYSCIKQSICSNHLKMSKCLYCSTNATRPMLSLTFFTFQLIL